MGGSLELDINFLLTCLSFIFSQLVTYAPVRMLQQRNHLCLLLLVRQAGYIVNLSDFYSYRLRQLEIAVMARYGTLSRRPAKEQPPANMRDDKTANTDHTHIPLPSLAPSITWPVSDRCDIAGVSVPPLRRSVRVVESNAFSIRNALWSSAEDDLLVQAVAKHSTSDVL
jgi:hypothetical protein